MNRKTSALNFPLESYYGSEHFSAEENSAIKASDEQFAKKMRDNTEGEILGHFQWDEELQDMKFIAKK